MYVASCSYLCLVKGLQANNSLLCRHVPQVQTAFQLDVTMGSIYLVSIPGYQIPCRRGSKSLS